MTRATTTITLRALQGEPLSDRVVRDMVIAAAHALAERHGVEVIDVAAQRDRVVCTLAAERIVALGFAAELRRSTNAWYEHKYEAGPMWGDAEPGTEAGAEDGAEDA